MPSKSELEHSRLAIEALADMLHAVVLGHPEDDPSKWDTLTVDAVLDIGGVQWAVEHLRVTWEPSVTPARSDVERHLRPRLEALARAHHVGLYVGLYPTRGDERSGQYDEIVAIAERVCRSRQDHYGADGFTIVVVISDVGEVKLADFQSDDPFIGSQIARQLVPAIRGKVQGQLLRASALGYSVGLLLDQTQPIGVAHRSIPYGSRETVQRVVTSALEPRSWGPDRIWLRDHSGAFHTLEEED